MPIRIVFEGNFACFTRPEFAAERMSYDLPPPTAARGMVEAIFWKPQMRYRVRRVSKLAHSSGRETRFMRITTNEVNVLGPCDIDARDPKGDIRNRAQRRNLVLRDAAFMVEVDILPGGQPITKPGHCLLTYEEMLTRRVEKGQCRETPCLGIRDYPASFRLATASDLPLDETRKLGPMTYLVWAADNWRPRNEPVTAKRTVITEPMVMMEQGSVNMEGWRQ